jgi:hypothetical protein
VDFSITPEQFRVDRRPWLCAAPNSQGVGKVRTHSLSISASRLALDHYTVNFPEPAGLDAPELPRPASSGSFQVAVHAAALTLGV